MSYLGGRILATDDRDRMTRLRRLICARMSSKRLPLQNIVIRNISRCGMSAASRGLAPTEGEEIRITLPHGEQAAGVVRWVKGLSFGLRLDQELDLTALVLQRVQQISSESAHWEVSRFHRVEHVDISNLRQI